MSTTHLRSIRNLSASRALLAVGIGLGSLAAFVPSASATEFYANPTVSRLNDCVNGVYHYDIGLYNFGANVNDYAHFDVTVDTGNGPHTNSYDIAPGGLQWLNFTLAEGVTGSFGVTSSGPDWVPVQTAAPRADCTPDPVGKVQVVCNTDGSATVHYDWDNTSYATAHMTAELNGATVAGGDYVWSDGGQSFDAAVAEDSHVTARVVSDGATVDSLDTTVDCVPAETTTTTVPDTIPTPDTTPVTTPETTPVTTPETTPVTTPDTTPVSTIPTESTTVISTMIPATATSVDPGTEAVPVKVASEAPTTSTTTPRLVAPSTDRLPTTGTTSSTTVALGAAMLLGGLGLVRVARRRVS